MQKMMKFFFAQLFSTLTKYNPPIHRNYKDHFRISEFGLTTQFERGPTIRVQYLFRSILSFSLMGALHK